MVKEIQQPEERKLPVENKQEIIEAEINHIANSNPYIATERDLELQRWLNSQKKSKVCGLVIEDKGSDLSRSCFHCSSNPRAKKEHLVSVPFDVVYVRTSQPGGANDVHTDILNVLERPLNTGNLRDLRKRVRGNLKAYKVKLLIVDDAHVLKRNAMVELIKIHEDLKIPVVMAGAYDLEEILSRTKGYEHINNAFLTIHNYRTLSEDEVASVVMTWEEEVLGTWDEKLNLADNEEIINSLYTLSRGLIQPLYGYLKKIFIAQLELDPSSEEGIEINEVIGMTRQARAYL